MYIVIELQTAATVSTLTYAYATRDEAESKYHLILSSAAVSNVPMHAAVLMTNEGVVLARQSYTHNEEE